MQTRDQIKANAELVIQELRPAGGMDFGYNKESVKRLEGHIEQLRLSGAFQVEETKNKLADQYGAFLGECIINCYGGDWSQWRGFWGVNVDKYNRLMPIGQVRDQMEKGLKSGISDFFRRIAELFVPVWPPPLDENISIDSSGPGVISNLFNTRFNEVMADGTFSPFYFAEELLAAKGLRKIVGEAVVQTAVLRIKRSLHEGMPTPEYLKAPEKFRKYLYSIITNVVEVMIRTRL
jgi:hypothetical protein